MISLSLFLIIWLILLGMFGLFAGISIVQMLRYGMLSPGTYVPTIAFFLTILLTLYIVSTRLIPVDWNQQVDMINFSQTENILIQ